MLRRKDAAYVLDDKANVVAKFEKKNGLYVTTLAVKNPKFQGFVRQA